MEAFEPTFYLREGDDLKSYGIDAEVIELMGHTNDSIGLVIEEDMLFVGKSLMNRERKQFISDMADRRKTGNG